MVNLSHLAHSKKEVTSNQANLFDKLIKKYKKQLEKNSLIVDELLALPWRSKVVESSAEFTSARVDRIDGYLNLRVPFNKNFIKEMNQHKPNDSVKRFEWINEEKLYRGLFSIVALKELHEVLPKFFKSVTYAPDLFNIINEIEKHDKYIWDPTLIKCGDRYVVASTNQYVQDAIEHINLDTLDLDTAFELSQYGVKVHPSLYNDNTAIKFASEFYTEIDINELDLVCGWLKEMKVTDISTTDDQSIKVPVVYDLVHKDFIQVAEKYGIQLNKNTRTKDNTRVFMAYSLHGTKKQMLFQNPEFNFKKIIKVKDSRPPIIK